MRQPVFMQFENRSIRTTSINEVWIRETNQGSIFVFIALSNGNQYSEKIYDTTPEAYDAMANAESRRSEIIGAIHEAESKLD